MTLFSLRLRCELTKIHSSVVYLFLRDGLFSAHRICRHHFRAYPSSQLVEPQNRITFETKYLSTVAGTILVQARDPGKIAMEIQISLDEHRLDDAWKFFEQHMNMDGFPRKSVVNQLLVTSVESPDAEWLEKAFELVQRAFEEGKESLLHRDPLIYLSFSLARAGSPVPASTVLRKLVEMDQYPPVSAWVATLAHISKTAPGAYLAAELVREMGYLFQDSRIDPSKKSNDPLIAMKPNATAFSIALAGCLLFGTARKAEQLLEMMPRVGVKVDSALLVAMAHTHERNGRRNELMKLEQRVNEARDLTEVQFRQFRSCLLSCHLKLGDVDSASEMVLEMLRKANAARLSVAAASLATGGIVNENKDENENKSSQPPGLTPMISYREYSKDRKFAKLETEAKEMLGAMLAKLESRVELLTAERGIIQPTQKVMAKLVKAFLEAGRTKDLAGFLIKVERENLPVSNDESILVRVIESCVSAGWLEKAHDLIDETRLAGVRAAPRLYSSLMKAYCRANRAGEAASLLRDAKMAGVQLDADSYQELFRLKVMGRDTQDALRLFKEMNESRAPESGGRGEFEKLMEGCTWVEEGGGGGGEGEMMGRLVEEIKGGQRGAEGECGVHEWNNVIHFFSRKRLMRDAEKALAKMKSLGYSPNAQTFHSMITGYAAIRGEYEAVTELWGQMKSRARSARMGFDQELLDSVLYVFVRGGFFGRANEVVEMMEKEKMFVDRYKYRTLFLKYHKTMYKGKAPKFQTESNLRKREEGLAFKKWVGLD